MDIKPGNFLLSVEQIQEDEWPIVKLCDFGLSRLIGPDGYAISNERAGTEDYIAPEVGKGRITQAVDMWSLGIFLHILTVGYPPNAMRWEPG